MSHTNLEFYGEWQEKSIHLQTCFLVFKVVRWVLIPPTMIAMRLRSQITEKKGCVLKDGAAESESLWRNVNGTRKGWISPRATFRAKSTTSRDCSPRFILYSSVRDSDALIQAGKWTPKAFVAGWLQKKLRSVLGPVSATCSIFPDVAAAGFQPKIGHPRIFGIQYFEHHAVPSTPLPKCPL